jgi:hypothetical protein
MAPTSTIISTILILVEETRLSGQMPLSLNSTFIALIPKKEISDTLDDLGQFLCAIVSTRSFPKS